MERGIKLDDTQKNEHQGAWLSLRIAVALPPSLLLGLFVHCKSYYLELAIILGTLAVSIWIATKTSALQRKWSKCFFTVIGIAFIICVSAISLWPCINSCNVPENSCNAPGFKGKVLVLPPHQDDELNMLGGAMESISKDCELFFLYYTDDGETRANEARRAIGKFGIGDDHIFSLGFGPGGWSPHKHIYNSPKNEIVIRNGKEMTKSHSASQFYRENLTFTQEHLEEVLRDFIREMRPDIIIGVDYDPHGDHREFSLTTERVLGDIMKKDSYRPTVLKSFAYSSAWFQPADFYADNLKRTEYTGKDGCMEEVNCYSWDDRLRIPVGKSSITRSLVGNLTASAFNEHISQHPVNPLANERICNGDKVFWWRPTCNLMWDAQVTAASGDAAQLHDFLLYDTSNVSDFNHKPCDHGWRPEGGKGMAEIRWASPVVVREIHLFDQNDTANQVKRLTIRLSNGRELSVGPLPAGGTRMVVPTGCSEPISGFTVSIDDSTGDGSGLAEIEAYAETPEPPFQVTKLQDADGNFMYDYTTAPDGNLAFSLYTWGCSGKSFKVELGETSCNGMAIEKSENGYMLQVPQGESCVLEVRNADGTMLDAARVSNPGALVRAFRQAARKMDPVMVKLSWESQYRYYSTLFTWVKSFV